MAQGIVKIQSAPPGPVKVIQKQAEVSSRTGKVLIRDIPTGKFVSKS